VLLADSHTELGIRKERLHRIDTVLVVTCMDAESGNSGSIGVLYRIKILQSTTLQELCTYQRVMSTPSTTKAVGAAGFELSADTVLKGATAATAAAAAVAAVVAAVLFCRLCALEGASRCVYSAKHVIMISKHSQLHCYTIPQRMYYAGCSATIAPTREHSEVMYQQCFCVRMLCARA
jgi:hypothetical protein